MKSLKFLPVLLCFACFGCATVTPAGGKPPSDLETLAAMYREGRAPRGFVSEDHDVLQWGDGTDERYNRFHTYIILKKKLLNDGRRAVPFIRKLLGVRQDQLCILGCIAAGRTGDTSLADPLIALLTDKNEDIQAHASYALIEIGKRSQRAARGIFEKLRALEKRGSYKYCENRRGLYIVRKLNIKEAIPDIMSLLSREHRVVPKLSAVNALAEMRVKEAVPKLITLLRDKAQDPTVRFRCAVALAKLDPAQAKLDLVVAVEDADAVVRWGAAMAFKKNKARESIPVLIEAITDKSQKVSAEAIRALYFQTGQKLTHDFIERPYAFGEEEQKLPDELKKAQKTWRDWWDKNKHNFK